MVSVLYTTVVIVLHFSALVCSVECEDEGISMAGMIVCGLVLLIAAVITVIYIKSRRTHRQRLTTQHSLDVFLRLMKDEDVRQRIGVLDKTGQTRRGLVTKKVHDAVLEYQRQHTENKKIGKASNLSEDPKDKFLERKAAMERLVKELERRLILDSADLSSRKIYWKLHK